VLIREDAEPVEVNSAGAQIREGEKMSQFRQIREERMKTRIFSVLGVLLLCGVITTWGSKAWAGVCGTAGPGGSCMLGSYSCTGFGFYDDGDSKEDSFTSSGVLNFTATSLANPTFAGWIFNNAGEPQFGIRIAPGDITEFGTTGQGTLNLAFEAAVNSEFDFDGDKVSVPQNFNYVASNIVNGIANQFTLQAIPADDQLDLIWLIECDIQ
jgi:hypothetical protein